jgi:hypothetical protein
MSKLNVIFPEKGDRKKDLNSLSDFDCSQPIRIALPCSRRGHAAQPLLWRAVLHLMWGALYMRKKSKKIESAGWYPFECLIRGDTVIPVQPDGGEMFTKCASGHLSRSEMRNHISMTGTGDQVRSLSIDM